MRFHLTLITAIVLCLSGCEKNAVTKDDDTVIADDLKYEIEGTYLCEEYHDWWDWITDSSRFDFVKFDTITIYADSGLNTIIFEIDDESYSSLIYTADTLSPYPYYCPIMAGHKMLEIFPPDSIVYVYCPGLAPDCYDYFGKKIE